jgi:hypothetical protein
MSENDESRIIIDDQRVMLQIVASVTYDSRAIIYDRNMFMVQAMTVNGTVHIRHLCRKTAVLSCHRCLINTGVEKMNCI